MKKILMSFVFVLLLVNTVNAYDGYTEVFNENFEDNLMPVASGRWTSNSDPDDNGLSITGASNISGAYSLYMDASYYGFLEEVDLRHSETVTGVYEDDYIVDFSLRFPVEQASDGNAQLVLYCNGINPVRVYSDNDAGGDRLRADINGAGTTYSSAYDETVTHNVSMRYTESLNEVNFLLNGVSWVNLTGGGCKNTGSTFQIRIVTTSSPTYDWIMDDITYYLRRPTLNLSIYKENDSTLITDEITLSFEDSEGNFSQYQTSTGNFYSEDLPPSNYTVTLTSANYSTREYTFSLEGEDLSLDTYLLETGASSTVFTFQDKDDASLLEGVTLTTQRRINNSWVTVNVLTSDVTGRASFYYSSGEEYQFLASASGYLGKNWTLNPILFATYIIRMEKDSTFLDETDFSGISITFEPQEFVNNQSHAINFTFSSPYGDFTSYGFNATYDATTVQDSGSNAYGSVLSDTLIINGAEFGDTVTINFFYVLSSGTRKEFTRTFLIIDTDTLGGWKRTLGNHYGMGILERVIIAVSLTLLVAGAGAYFGGGIAGGVVGAFLLGLWGYTGFLPWWSVLISIVTMFITLSWRSTQ